MLIQQLPDLCLSVARGEHLQGGGPGISGCAPKDRSLWREAAPGALGCLEMHWDRDVSLRYQFHFLQINTQ